MRGQISPWDGSSAPKPAPIGGTVGVPISSADHASVAVAFPAGYFTTAPIVVASIDGFNYNWYAATGSISTAGCSITVAERNATVSTGNVTVRWIAIAP